MPAPNSPYQPYAESHQNPNGPGDRRPTALQIIKDEGLHGRGLEGKVFLITGCSTGIGVETARAIHATGADVYMTVRETKKAQGEAVVQDIRATSSGKGKLELIFLDLSSFASVRAAAEDFKARSPTLNVLVENAGVMLCPYSKTEDGWEMQMGTNHFGHFLLFQLLKERLLSSTTKDFSSRVVVVSSAGHHLGGIRFDDMNFDRDGYDGLKGYGQSKTANIYMASSIERHYHAENLHAVSVHPGAIFETNLPRHMVIEDVGESFDMEGVAPLSKSIAQGAATQVWAAVSKYFNNHGGTYLADVGEAGPFPEGSNIAVPGYVRHTYDEEMEERLWRLSCDAVGVKT